MNQFLFKGLLVPALVWLGILLYVQPVKAFALTEPIWSDENTGFAIGGFDPVAYFTDARPRIGEPGREVNWGGVSWAFANEGNRDAFISAPEVYAPRFGGYDPVSLMRGLLIEGDPSVWVMHQGGLYFFNDRVSRAIWSGSRAEISKQATEFWRKKLEENEPTLRLIEP